MKSLKAFDIEIFRLNDGKQQFEYEINDSFFASIEDSSISKGKLKASLEIDKSERHLQIEYKISGTVELICDRSLEPFDFELNENYSLIFKYGDAYEEVSEDVVIIPHDTPKLNMAQYLYEFILISIPMKKLHPKFQHEELDSDEEVTLVYRTEEEKNDQNETPEEVDPRWSALKNLKNNLN